MIKLKQILQERKQIGLLYHFTSINSATEILKGDRLISSHTVTLPRTIKNDIYFKGQKFFNAQLPVDSISFTRDKNFWNISRVLMGELSVKFIVDGDNLSDKYKIQPYNDFKTPVDTGFEKLKYDEMEEIVIAEAIPNFSKYVKGVIIKNEMAEKMNSKKYIFDFINACKEKNIKIERI